MHFALHNHSAIVIPELSQQLGVEARRQLCRNDTTGAPPLLGIAWPAACENSRVCHHIGAKTHPYAHCFAAYSKHLRIAVFSFADLENMRETATVIRVPRGLGWRCDLFQTKSGRWTDSSSGVVRIAASIAFNRHAATMKLHACRIKFLPSGFYRARQVRHRPEIPSLGANRRWSMELAFRARTQSRSSPLCRPNLLLRTNSRWELGELPEMALRGQRRTTINAKN